MSDKFFDINQEIAPEKLGPVEGEREELPWKVEKVEEEESSPHKIATVGRRAGNFVVDFFFMMVFVLIVGIILAAFGLPDLIENMNEWLFLFLLVSLYYLPQEGLFGRTIGKFVTRTKVIDLDGNPPGFKRAFYRTMLRFLPGEQFSFIKESAMGLHDLWSGTQVVLVEKTNVNEKPSLVRRILKGVGITVGIIILLTVAFVVFVGIVSPETRVLSAKEMSDDHFKTIDRLGLIEPDELVKYFYSDGVFSIEEGMYFVTDKKLVIYVEESEDPITIIPFEEIIEFQSLEEDEYYNTITMFVETEEFTTTFPLSTERSQHIHFRDYIQIRIPNQETN